LRPALKVLCAVREVKGRDLEKWEVRVGSRSIAMEFGIPFRWLVWVSMLMSNDIRRGRKL
jgi:hypothetical protein